MMNETQNPEAPEAIFQATVEKLNGVIDLLATPDIKDKSYISGANWQPSFNLLARAYKHMVDRKQLTEADQSELAAVVTSLEDAGTALKHVVELRKDKDALLEEENASSIKRKGRPLPEGQRQAWDERARTHIPITGTGQNSPHYFDILEEKHSSMYRSMLLAMVEKYNKAHPEKQFDMDFSLPTLEDATDQSAMKQGFQANKTGTVLAILNHFGDFVKHAHEEMLAARVDPKTLADAELILSDSAIYSGTKLKDFHNAKSFYRGETDEPDAGRISVTDYIPVWLRQQNLFKI